MSTPRLNGNRVCDRLRSVNFHHDASIRKFTLQFGAFHLFCRNLPLLRICVSSDTERQRHSMQQANRREMCYEARDQHFQCMDKHGASSAECVKTKEAYDAACPKSWVNYFNQQRERQTMLELQADISRRRSDRES